MSNLFSLVLNMSVTGSLVICIVMLARLCLKYAPKIFSYVLWSVVLFRLLCPVTVSAPVSVLRGLRPETTKISDMTSIAHYLPETAVFSENQEIVLTEEDSSESSEPSEWTPVNIASMCWISVALAMLLHSVVQYCKLRIQLIGAIACGENVYLAEGIGTAFVMGILRPRIYLPFNVPCGEHRFIIAHEKHHIRRFDHIIKILTYLALCVHWFNPFVWAAFILAGRDMEMSCDEAVIRQLGTQTRADYSAALLRLAKRKTQITGMPLSFGEGDTKGRVLNMAKWRKPKVWVITVCILICAAVLIICAVNPDGTDDQKYLNQCRRVLEFIQASEGYNIITLQENHGYIILNSSKTSNDYRYKDNWLQINTVPESTHSSVFAYMCLDGKYYEGRSFVENGIADKLEWEESGPTEIQQPWLADFRWDDSTVSLSDVEDTGTGTIISLIIKDTVTLRELTAQEYTVAFTFDKEGDFLEAKRTVEFPLWNGFTETMRVASLNADQINTKITLSGQNVTVSADGEEN